MQYTDFAFLDFSDFRGFILGFWDFGFLGFWDFGFAGSGFLMLRFWGRCMDLVFRVGVL